MALNDLYRLHFFIDCARTPTECVVGYELTSGGYFKDTGEALCQAWIDAVQPSLLAALSDESKVTRVQVTTVTSVDELPGFIDEQAQDGTVVSQALPANAAYVIHLGTDAPNAKHNGRVYIAGGPENGVQEGTVEAPQLALLNTLATKMDDVLIPSAPETAEFTPVVISTVLNGAPRVPPVGFAVTNATARTIVRQQRRRKTRQFGYI